MDTSLLNLPFSTQLVLVAGYLSYRINAAGTEKSYKQIDTLFQILVFGFIAYISFIILGDGEYNINESIHIALRDGHSIFAALFSILISIACAISWKKWIFSHISKILKAGGITEENYHPSTLDSIIRSNKVSEWNYVSLSLKDGYTFESDIACVPNWVPCYPLDIDSNGNIGIYVTRYYRPNEEVPVECEADVFNDETKSSNISYIPHNEIARIDVRWVSK